LSKVYREILREILAIFMVYSGASRMRVEPALRALPLTVQRIGLGGNVEAGTERMSGHLYSLH